MELIRKPIYAALILIGLSLILFYPFLGQVHLFDWDEINFAEAAREMIVTGNYSTVQINYKPFWEKPPLFFWMQAISMKLFGIGEYAARFPNAICGTLTLLLFLIIGKRRKNLTFGFIWGILYLASALPQLYFKSGIIDPWFNFFIFSGVYLAYEYILSYQQAHEKLKFVIFSGIAIGLGVMTKGPVALLIFLLTAGVFWASLKFQRLFTWKAVLTFTLSFLITGGLWFFIEILSGRLYVVQDFITYQIRLLETQDAGHGGPFLYHWYVLLIGCFPLSVPAIWSMFKGDNQSDSSKLLQRLMLVLFWVVLLLFSLVKTKIIHYSSMCYFPMSYLAATYVYNHWTTPANKWHNVLLALVGVLFSIILLAAPAVGANLDQLINSGMVQDKFAEANMQAQNNWSVFDYLSGILFVVGLLGYFFAKTKLKWPILLSSTTLAFTLMGALIVPKVENISQRAAIEFFKDRQGEDCYVETYSYKSYADIFYTRKPIPTNENHNNDQWLLSGGIDKPVYMVCKITKKEEFMSGYPQFSLLYEKNGFVFFKRDIN